MALTKCPYEILEVSKDASPEEIKKAYRSMSKRHHADLNESDPSYDAMGMIEVNEAYAILSDPIRRAKYDEYGSICTDADEAKYAVQCAVEFFLNGMRASSDPLKQARVGLKFEVSNTNKKVDQLKGAMDHMLKTAEKLSVKDGTENVIKNAVVNAANQIRVELQKERFKTTVQERALKLLENYDFLAEEEPQVFTSTITYKLWTT